ncbi:hypothetical protein [Actinomadura sp. 7K507]|uniref:hypothetical protein n=1 Tax=Actinomadura sp. 7K507 TaxID=2530365 RepID=UPI001FB654A0|nr:hypothetical protein [Actinomadura sp. 7K507]
MYGILWFFVTVRCSTDGVGVGAALVVGGALAVEGVALAVVFEAAAGDLACSAQAPRVSNALIAAMAGMRRPMISP